MVGLNILDLRSQPKYREPARAGTKPLTFRGRDARKEDEYRTRAIRRALANAGKTARGAKKPFKRKHALRLLKRLDYRDGEPPKTLAAAAYVCRARKPILDELVRLSLCEEHGRVVTGALLPSNGRIPAGKLRRVQARRWMKRLLSDLNRCGLATADGYLIATLHGEFDPTALEYDLHYHIAASEGLVPVVEKLRSRRKYKLAILNEEQHYSSAPRIQLQALNSGEARYTLSYLFQHWWPSRWRGVNDAGGKIRGPRRRIPEPYHTEWLLWMDRQRLQDLTLLVHLRVGRRGLQVKVAGKAYTNGGKR